MSEPPFGILASLDAIFEGEEISLELPGTGEGTPLGEGGDSESSGIEPVEPGAHRSAIIVLLTDGQATEGPNPLQAAEIAAALGSAQLPKLNGWNEKRRRNALWLNEHIERAVTPIELEGAHHVFQQYTVRIEYNRRDAVRAARQPRAHCSRRGRPGGGHARADPGRRGVQEPGAEVA